MSKIDLVKDKKRIITNILNFGTKKAVDWLFSEYTKSDLEEAVVRPLPGEWNKKSINFWSIIFEVSPLDTSRQVG
jgi:hypothetical protein